jgi:hypothetical protein
MDNSSSSTRTGLFLLIVIEDSKIVGFVTSILLLTLRIRFELGIMFCELGELTRILQDLITKLDDRDISFH